MKKLKSSLFITILFILVSNQSFAEVKRLKLATTTSTVNSGLLEQLNPPFEEKNNIKIDVISVGSGKAIRLAVNGDVDMVLSHAPKAEQKFVASGYGIERKPVMHNDFVIVGPKNDPSNIKDMKSIKEVMASLYKKGCFFVSRGDDSGTHKKEKQLWDLIKKKPQGNWFLSVGQDMGTVLRIADDKKAYTLTDRGTYTAYRKKINLDILYENDELLFNPYHVIIVNPNKHKHVKYEFAQKYSNFIRGEQGQEIIRNFRIENEILFYPDVIK